MSPAVLVLMHGKNPALGARPLQTGKLKDTTYSGEYGFRHNTCLCSFFVLLSSQATKVSLMQLTTIDQTASSSRSNPYNVVPATGKRIRFARTIAQRTRADLPADVTSDRHRLSRWIDAHCKQPNSSPFSNYPSSKQVAFAERIARVKHRDVPRECFRDKTLMSKWIDYNR